MNPPSDLSKWVDILFKLAVVVGPFIGVIVIHYLKTWFVTHEDFNKIVPRIDSMERTILLMANQRNQLDDHEDRIRVLEQR